MKRTLILSLLLLTLTPALADSLLDTSNDIFAPRQVKVGDLITISISDRSQTTQNVAVQSDNSGGITGPLASLAKTFIGIDLGHDDQAQRQESANSTTRFSDTVTAKVIKVEADRLHVQASRSVEIDGKKKTLALQGVCRRADVGTDNMVASDLLSDAVIKVDGIYNSPVQPGLLTRAFRLFF